MENDEWYEFDFSQRKYVLTDKAPAEAQESYKKFCEELEKLGMP